VDCLLSKPTGAAEQMTDWNELFTYKEGKLFNKLGAEIGSGFRGRVRVNYNRYRTSNVIYEMHYGVIPEGAIIDHIDRNPLNNKVENLRVATISQNNHNTKRANGYAVRYLKDGTKVFRAKINVDGVAHHLGTYSNPYEAHGAYLEAKKELCGEFAPI
jgi:hypothetical protein